MNIKTTLHHYRFDLTDDAQRAAYDKLRAETLNVIGFPVWRMHADFHNPGARKPTEDFIDKVRAAVGRVENTHGVTSGPVELETAHLFANQWNGSELRLFNWAECAYANRNIREGYYLEQTEEMREVLRATVKCGYCGHQKQAAQGYTFCPDCLGSEYLKPSDLHLLRMVPVCRTDDKRAPLTEAERAHLMPLYSDAQINGANARDVKRIAQIKRDAVTKRDQAIANAKEEHDAVMWIMANMPGVIGNWIYYSHSAKHSFGWRNPIDSETLELLLSKISEFPYAYEIKCADGRTLEGY